MPPFLLWLCEAWGADGAGPLRPRRFAAAHYATRLACVRACVNFYTGLSTVPFRLADTVLQGQRLLRLYTTTPAAEWPGLVSSVPSSGTTCRGP